MSSDNEFLKWYDGYEANVKLRYHLELEEMMLTALPDPKGASMPMKNYLVRGPRLFFWEGMLQSKIPANASLETPLKAAQEFWNKQDRLIMRSHLVTRLRNEYTFAGDLIVKQEEFGLLAAKRRATQKLINDIFLRTERWKPYLHQATGPTDTEHFVMLALSAGLMADYDDDDVKEFAGYEMFSMINVFHYHLDAEVNGQRKQHLEPMFTIRDQDQLHLA